MLYSCISTNPEYLHDLFSQKYVVTSDISMIFFRWMNTQIFNSLLNKSLDVYEILNFSSKIVGDSFLPLKIFAKKLVGLFPCLQCLSICFYCFKELLRLFQGIFVWLVNFRKPKTVICKAKY